MTAFAIAASYFPEATEDIVDYIIWNHTGFPSSWSIPEDGATAEDCFRYQLLRYRLLCRWGIRPDNDEIALEYLPVEEY